MTFIQESLMDIPKIGRKRSFSTIIRTYKRGHFVPMHTHVFPQLLYASSGVMSVETPYGSWIVPADRAVWLPPACPHEVRMLTDMQFNSLHIRPKVDWVQRECKVIEVTPLLRELVLVAQTVDIEKQISKRDQLIMQLIAEELRASKSAVSPIPMPRQPRLLRFCRRIIENPSLQLNFDILASQAGGSTKTFSRLFDKELGMTFRDWRERVQIAHAIAYLSRGDSIKATSSRLGYTPSSFSVMVRRLTNGTAQQLRSRLLKDQAGH